MIVILIISMEMNGNCPKKLEDDDTDTQEDKILDYYNKYGRIMGVRRR